MLNHHFNRPLLSVQGQLEVLRPCIQLVHHRQFDAIGPRYFCMATAIPPCSERLAVFPTSPGPVPGPVPTGRGSQAEGIDAPGTCGLPQSNAIQIGSAFQQSTSNIKASTFASKCNFNMMRRCASWHSWGGIGYSCQKHSFHRGLWPALNGCRPGD